jgi:hypothetical protein
MLLTDECSRAGTKTMAVRLSLSHVSGLLRCVNLPFVATVLQIGTGRMVREATLA